MTRAVITAAGILFSLAAFALAYMGGRQLGTGTGLFLMFCIAGGLVPMCYYITEGDNSCD